MPKVDVIIPAFNAAKHLPAALESVLSQTFGDWRIILVNDGSTDATAEVASRFQQQLGDRMLVITQANAGMSAARNAAIRASSGDLVAMLDSDDVWLTSRLEESLKPFASRPEVGLSYGMVTRIDEAGTPFYTFAGNPKNAEGKVARYIYTRQIELPCVTVTFRRQCIEEVGLFDETMRATEDRDLWLRIALRYEVAFIPRVIAYYRTYPTSTTGNMDRMLNAQLQFVRKNYGLPGCGFAPRQIALSRAYKQRGEVFSDRGHAGKALLSSLRACLIWPFSQDNLRSAASLTLNWMHIKRPPR